MGTQRYPKNVRSGKKVVRCVSDDGLGCREFLRKFLLEIGKLPSLSEDVVWAMLYFKQKSEFSREDPAIKLTRSRKRPKGVGEAKISLGGKTSK